MLSFINVIGFVAISIVTLAVYRLYFHPLAKVPGPKIAALTSWYCIYYDVFGEGRYIWAIKDMHEKYGPIVRIMPDVVHVNDPAFIDQIYPAQAPDKKRERAYTVINKFLDKLSVIPTKDHDLHRRRRAVLSPFFSQKNVRALVPTINETLANLLLRIQQAGASEEKSVLTLNPLVRAATTDVIQSYAFGSNPENVLIDDCNAGFFETMSPKEFTHTCGHFPWLGQMLYMLPPSLVLKLNPSAETFIAFMKDLEQRVEKIRASHERPDRMTVFHDILASQIPEAEKSTPRLINEAMVITIAGSDTTALTMLALIYHVLSDKQLFERLRHELNSVMPNFDEPPDASKLDQLTFLNALIEESLRMYPSAVGRQDRVAPEQDLIYQYPDGRAIKLPAGTVMGMTAPLINRHPGWFDDPDTFNPDRYIDNPALFRRNLTFSKGGRVCLGMNLAYQEMQTFIAGIFRKYSRYDESLKSQPGPTLELFETTKEDFEMYSDYVTPHPKPGSHGVRVRVRSH